jgi:hypothetical protein
MTTELPEEFMQRLKESKDSLKIPRSDVLSRNTADQILEDIKTEYNLETTYDSLAVLTVFAQQGATAKNCDGNMEIGLFNIKFKLSTIRKIFANNSAKNGIRKFARTYAGKINLIAQTYRIHGNLASKIRKANPNRQFTTEELVFLSDFQCNNPNVPSDLRKLILESFKTPGKNTNLKKT